MFLVIPRASNREQSDCGNPSRPSAVPVRVKQACERCRLKKLKCDGRFTCGRCVQDRMQCRRTRLPTTEKASSRQYIASLEAQQAQLVDAVKYLCLHGAGANDGVVQETLRQLELNGFDACSLSGESKIQPASSGDKSVTRSEELQPSEHLGPTQYQTHQHTGSGDKSVTRSEELQPSEHLGPTQYQTHQHTGSGDKSVTRSEELQPSEHLSPTQYQTHQHTGSDPVLFLGDEDTIGIGALQQPWATDQWQAEPAPIDLGLHFQLPNECLEQYYTPFVWADLGAWSDQLLDSTL